MRNEIVEYLDIVIEKENAQSKSIKKFNFNGFTCCLYCKNDNIKLNKILQHERICPFRPNDKNKLASACPYNIYHRCKTNYLPQHINECSNKPFYNNRADNNEEKDTDIQTEINQYISKNKGKPNKLLVNEKNKKQPFGYNKQKMEYSGKKSDGICICESKNQPFGLIEKEIENIHNQSNFVSELEDKSNKISFVSEETELMNYNPNSIDDLQELVSNIY